MFKLYLTHNATLPQDVRFYAAVLLNIGRRSADALQLAY